MSKSNEYVIEIIDKLFQIFHIEDMKISLFAKYVLGKYIEEGLPIEIQKRILMSSHLVQNGSLLNISNNILKILSIYIICKYKYWMNRDYKRDLSDSVKYNSDERVLVILKNLYHQFDLNYDIMQFIILNTQIALSKEGSVFTYKNSGIGINDSLKISGAAYNPKLSDKDFVIGANLVDCMCKVQTYCKLVSANIGSRDISDNMGTEKLLENLNDLLDAIRFFSNIELIVNDDNSIVFKENQKYISSYGIMRLLESEFSQELIFLSGIRREKDENKYRLVLTYKDLLECDTYTYYIQSYYKKEEDKENKKIILVDSPENYYIGITGHVLTNRQMSFSFSALVSYNYKYINKLALAIVDSIEGSDYQNCRENLVGLMYANEEFFAEELAMAKINDNIEGNEDYDVLNWDLVLTKLLTFESPTKVLRILLSGGKKANINVMDKIIVNLNLRLQDSFDIKSAFMKRQMLVDDITKQLIIFNDGQGLVNSEFINDWRNHIILESSIRALVSSLADAQDENTNNDLYASSVYTSSIHDRISFLSNINFNKNVDWEKVRDSCNRMLSDVLHVYLCFYAGLIGCVSSRLSYETESFNKCLTNNDIKKWQIAIENSFFESVTQKAQELSSIKDVGTLLLKLKKTYEECFSSQDSDDLSQQGRAIKALLGHNLIDFNALSNYIDYSDNIVVLKYYTRDGEIKSVPLDDINRNNVADYTICVESILKFLAGDSKTGDTQLQKFRKMVYPMTATFSGNRTNRDKNSIMQFSLILKDRTSTTNYFNNDNSSNNIPMSQRLNEISISTEFQYQINDHFYCLPNIDRITGYLWADPILIQCQRFNDAMRAGIDSGNK